MWELVHHIKQYSMQLTAAQHRVPKRDTNFTIVDWGTVVSTRSFGKERITGDLKPHYGLEARLLFAQQLLHELLLASLKERKEDE